jgi:hypothetical protein
MGFGSDPYTELLPALLNNREGQPNASSQHSSGFLIAAIFRFGFHTSRVDSDLMII